MFDVDCCGMMTETNDWIAAEDIGNDDAVVDALTKHPKVVMIPPLWCSCCYCYCYGYDCCCCCCCKYRHFHFHCDTMTVMYRHGDYEFPSQTGIWSEICCCESCWCCCVSCWCCCVSSCCVFVAEMYIVSV